MGAKSLIPAATSVGKSDVVDAGECGSDTEARVVMVPSGVTRVVLFSTTNERSGRVNETRRVPGFDLGDVAECVMWWTCFSGQSFAHNARIHTRDPPENKQSAADIVELFFFLSPAASVFFPSLLFLH